VNVTASARSRPGPLTPHRQTRSRRAVLRRPEPSTFCAGGRRS